MSGKKSRTKKGNIKSNLSNKMDHITSGHDSEASINGIINKSKPDNIDGTSGDTGNNPVKKSHSKSAGTKGKKTSTYSQNGKSNINQDNSKDINEDIIKSINIKLNTDINSGSSDLIAGNNSEIDSTYKNDINDNHAEKTDNKTTAENDSQSDEQTISNDDLGVDEGDGLTDTSSEQINEPDKKKKWNVYRIFRIICIVGFFVFLLLFLNEVFLQPYLTDKSNHKARTLYQSISPTPTEAVKAITESPSPTVIAEVKKESVTLTPVPSPVPSPALALSPARDNKGRLLAFKELLRNNEDVKGWIILNNINGENDTKIDYVVMQSSNGDPEYYLTRDWQGNKLKSGSLFLDYKSSVEKDSKNLVIHGHNMTSTDDMFHYLMKYKKIEFYREHPIIKFDTIYKTGYWKVFAVFITNGTSKKEPLFDYTVPEFNNSSEFLNFVYQLRVRSLYNIDTVDVNENDQLLTLSTCTYEVKNYRLVIVARRVRDGEDLTVDTGSAAQNPDPLYPKSYYYDYGGKAPKIPDTFEEALAEGKITWYKPLQNQTNAASD